MTTSEHMTQRWRFNAVNALYDPDVELNPSVGAGQEKVMGDANILGKRSVDDSEPVEITSTKIVCDKNPGAIVPVGNTANGLDQFGGQDPLDSSLGTPQKNPNKKKLKADDGAAIDSKSTREAAASVEEDHRKQ